MTRAAPLAAMLALSALLFACGSGNGPGGGAEQAVVRIEAEPCGGLQVLEATAVAIAPDLLVTVAHSFERIRGFEVTGADGQTLTAELISLDIERDLALLRTEEPLTDWLEFGTATENQVTRILSAADADELEVKRAVILDIKPVTLDGVGERQALQLQADIRNGDSGSPVVSESGELVGMVFATTRGAERGWAIAADEIEATVAQAADGPAIEPDCGRDP